MTLTPVPERHACRVGILRKPSRWGLGHLVLGSTAQGGQSDLTPAGTRNGETGRWCEKEKQGWAKGHQGTNTMISASQHSAQGFGQWNAWWGDAVQEWGDPAQFAKGSQLPFSSSHLLPRAMGGPRAASAFCFSWEVLDLALEASSFSNNNQVSENTMGHCLWFLAYVIHVV